MLPWLAMSAYANAVQISANTMKPTPFVIRGMTASMKGKSKRSTNPVMSWSISVLLVPTCEVCGVVMPDRACGDMSGLQRSEVSGKQRAGDDGWDLGSKVRDYGSERPESTTVRGRGASGGSPRRTTQR
jgi:hypothetical protein